ncbi:MAG: branched-chain amino acid ABC transporter permease [Eubacteriales bacterium]|nr:branched-chain amino acid ABC transporter permease [Eubacteriales bacterium]
MLNEKKISKRALANLSAIIVLFAIVMIIDCTSNSYDMIVKVAQKVCVYSIVAVSMNLLNGFTGLFSLGQAGFMLLGAYTCAVFIIPDEYRQMVYSFSIPEGTTPIINFELPLLVAILLGGLVAALFAFLIGLPVLKLKSDYLAIATLGFAEIVRTIIVWDKLGPLTNGSFPLSRLRTFKSVLEGTVFEKFSLVMPYFLFAVVCILIIVLMIRSSYGRALKAIRDDEIAAEAMGINLARHKMISFVTSSFFAGIGGALFAVYQGSVSAAPFTSSMTYEILLIVVIGGIGSITGSVLASALFIASSEWWLRGLDSGEFLGFSLPIFRNGFRLVVFSVIIMVFVLFFRRGIMGDHEFDVVAIWKNIKKLFCKIFRRKAEDKK